MNLCLLFHKHKCCIGMAWFLHEQILYVSLHVLLLLFYDHKCCIWMALYLHEQFLLVSLNLICTQFHIHICCTWMAWFFHEQFLEVLFYLYFGFIRFCYVRRQTQVMKNKSFETFECYLYRLDISECQQHTRCNKWNDRMEERLATPLYLSIFCKVGIP